MCVAPFVHTCVAGVAKTRFARAAAESLDLVDNFLWIFADSSLDVQQYSDLPAWEFMHVQKAVPASVNPAYDAFIATWPTATTIYDEAIHGVYNATTHAPLFDHDEVFFDTDYGPVGDGVPDVWGMYVYDTVVLYANSVKDVLDQGASVHDGAVLKEALISTSQQMIGVTGEMAFDRESQDRDSVYQLDAWVGPQALVRRSEPACVALAARSEPARVALARRSRAFALWQGEVSPGYLSSVSPPPSPPAPPSCVLTLSRSCRFVVALLGL